MATIAMIPRYEREMELPDEDEDVEVRIGAVLFGLENIVVVNVKVIVLWTIPVLDDELVLGVVVVELELEDVEEDEVVGPSRDITDTVPLLLFGT